ncbi:hypothetical protein R1sor_005639 [Riccia sorocarpa]|uniref:Uncharacterized protein n=1 Tax=Riccia sorocarpa TaxID=122646 RepID=A0ABD3HKN7_9MARC
MACLQLEQICTSCFALQRNASRDLSSRSQRIWRFRGTDRGNCSSRPERRNILVTSSYPRTYRELAKGVGLEEFIGSSTETEQARREERQNSKFSQKISDSEAEQLRIRRGNTKQSQRISNSDAAELSRKARPIETNRGENASSSASCGSTSDLDCEHFSRCSGCVIDKTLDKPHVMRDAVSFFKQNGIEDMALTTCGTWEWRCRAKLAVRGTAENPLIGLYEEGSHDIVDIPNCRAHHPRINEAVGLLKEAIKALGVQPYKEETQTGQLRYVQMVVTTFNSSLPAAERYAEGKVQVSLVWNARDEKSIESRLLQPLADYLWRKGGKVRKDFTPILHSVWANFQTSRTNIIFGGKWRHLLGEDQLWERIGGADICFTPATFGQANLQAFEALLRRLQKKVRRGSAVVELYAGVGVIGISLAVTRACRSVKCVEVNKEAKDSFQLSLARVPASVDSKISWRCADASVSPIYWLDGADVVVVDPPRKGLDPSVVEALRVAALRGQGKQKPSTLSNTSKVEKRPWILRAKQDGVVKETATGVLEEDLDSVWPDTLIYVSCGWESFKRDCAALTEGDAWHLDDGHAFSFFPGTDSIETLAVFKRGKRTENKSSKKRSRRKTGPIPFVRKVALQFVNDAHLKGIKELRSFLHTAIRANST